MTLKDAIANRITELCKQHGIAPNELANRAGVNHLRFTVFWGQRASGLK